MRLGQLRGPHALDQSHDHAGSRAALDKSCVVRDVGKAILGDRGGMRIPEQLRRPSRPGVLEGPTHSKARSSSIGDYRELLVAWLAVR